MGNSRLRPETISAPDMYAPRGVAAYYAIYNAVKAQPGLIYGRLDNPKGEHCAIGAYFDTTKQALSNEIIDEIAAVNDSVPPSSSDNRRKRKQAVLRYLRWKLAQHGFRLPGGQVKTP